MKLNTTTLLIFGLTLLTVLILFSFTNAHRPFKRPILNRSNSARVSNYPSPYPSPRYTIEAISPADGKNNVDLKTPITVTLSSAPDNDVQLYIEPVVAFDRKVNGNKLIFTPKTRYASGTAYTYSIRLENQDFIPSSYSFTTSGIAIKSQSNESEKPPTELWDKSDAYQKQHRPDIYIKNKLPYENDFFSVRAELIDDPTYSYYQIVIEPKIEDEEMVRAEAQKWFEKIGLSEEQLSRVKVIYYF